MEIKEDDKFIDANGNVWSVFDIAPESDTGNRYHIVSDNKMPESHVKVDKAVIHWLMKPYMEKK